MRLVLETEQQTLALGEGLLNAALASPDAMHLILLHGNLGMGKTTMTRGLLRAAGYDGAVKSPTYTLVETYELDQLTVNHFDLYRLGDPEELEFMGIRDYFSPKAETDAKRLCLVEWPERAGGLFPPATVEIFLAPLGEGRVAKVTAEAAFIARLRSNLGHGLEEQIVGIE